MKIYTKIILSFLTIGILAQSSNIFGMQLARYLRSGARAEVSLADAQEKQKEKTNEKDVELTSMLNAKARPLRITNFINNAKNGTSSALNCVYKTIKSDLGLEPQVEPYSLTKDILAGCRLACYDLLGRLALGYGMSKIISLPSLPPQYNNFSPDFLTAMRIIIQAPLMEELTDTYLMQYMLGLGPISGPIIGTALFGAAHHHENSKRWAFQFVSCIPTIVHRLHVQQYIKSLKSKRIDPEIKLPPMPLAPFISHALHNALAFYMLSQKK